MNPIYKEYLWSSFVTFVTAFLTAILPTLGTVSFSQAAIFALLAVGARAGFKALLNLLTTRFSSVSSAAK